MKDIDIYIKSAEILEATTTKQAFHKFELPDGSKCAAKVLLDAGLDLPDALEWSIIAANDINRYSFKEIAFLLRKKASLLGNR